MPGTGSGFGLNFPRSLLKGGSGGGSGLTQAEVDARIASHVKEFARTDHRGIAAGDLDDDIISTNKLVDRNVTLVKFALGTPNTYLFYDGDGLPVYQTAPSADPTNLGITAAADKITISSSTGDDVEIVGATDAAAGILTAEQKRNLDAASRGFYHADYSTAVVGIRIGQTDNFDNGEFYNHFTWDEISGQELIIGGRGAGTNSIVFDVRAADVESYRGVRFAVVNNTTNAVSNARMTTDATNGAAFTNFRIIKDLRYLVTINVSTSGVVTPTLEIIENRGLTAVSSDDTLTGAGTGGNRLSVANPFTDGDETKLDGIEEQATKDQTADEIKTALETLEDDARLDASAVKNLPSGGGGTADPTNLGITAAGDKVTISSSTGTDVEIPGATNTAAGVLTAEQKRILDASHIGFPKAELTSLLTGIRIGQTSTFSNSNSYNHFTWEEIAGQELIIEGNRQSSSYQFVFDTRSADAAFFNGVSFAVVNKCPSDISFFYRTTNTARGQNLLLVGLGGRFEAGSRHLVTISNDGNGDPVFELLNARYPGFATSSQVEVGSSEFSGNLSPSDNTVKKALTTIDQLDISGGGGGGLTSVASDATLTGTGVSSDQLSVANPFTADDESKLDGIADGATANEGTITAVQAGTGLTGGANSGTATLAVTINALNANNVALSESTEFMVYNGTGVVKTTLAALKTFLGGGGNPGTHKRYVGLKTEASGADFVAADFESATLAASSTTDFVTTPTFTGDHYMAYAIPSSQPAITVWQEKGTNFNAVDVLWNVGTVELDGEDHVVYRYGSAADTPVLVYDTQSGAIYEIR